MNVTTKRRGHAPACACLLALMLALLPVSRTAHADSGIEVSGTFHFTLFQFTGPTTAVGSGILTGDTTGTFSAIYFNIEQEGQGAYHLNGMHSLVTPAGTLYTFDDIHLQFSQQDPAVGRVNSQVYVIGGTGAYAGASGLLHTHGVVNFFTLDGGIDFKGQIDLP